MPEDSSSGGAELNHAGTDSTSNFVASQMDAQSGAAAAEDVDAEQRAAFMARAMAESRRMSAETAKSEQKRRELYAEMGHTAESMAALTNEHIREVQAAAQLPSSQPEAELGAELRTDDSVRERA
jgi:hypothetical protein|eukprot:SAG25_NODE_206_length_11883_cov_5.639511_7_plen_125_part_00